MKNILLTTLAVSVVSLFVGCGDSGSDSPEANANTNDSSSSEAEATPAAAAEITAADRDAFLGTWKGKYSGLDDEMIIEAGESPDAVVVTIHSTYENPDKVNGKLVSPDKIEIPKQSMGGMSGTATIMMADGKLKYEQKGGGMTVKGEGYEKQ